MQAHQIELLDSIRGLARTIYAETGQYTTYEEDYHTGDHVWASVAIQRADDTREFTIFRAACRPSPGYSTTFDQIHEDLIDWIVAHRKQEKAA